MRFANEMPMRIALSISSLHSSGQASLVKGLSRKHEGAVDRLGDGSGLWLIAEPFKVADQASRDIRGSEKKPTCQPQAARRP